MDKKSWAKKVLITFLVATVIIAAITTTTLFIHRQNTSKTVEVLNELLTFMEKEQIESYFVSKKSEGYGTEICYSVSFKNKTEKIETCNETPETKSELINIETIKSFTSKINPANEKIKITLSQGKSNQLIM